MKKLWRVKVSLNKKTGELTPVFKSKFIKNYITFFLMTPIPSKPNPIRRIVPGSGTTL